MAKLRNISLMLLLGGSLGVLSGCVDKSFDLDNYDSTSRIEVKDLTLPVLFNGALELDDVVDIEDNELVKVDANGNYVLIQNGVFESDEIYINEIIAEPANSEFDSEPVSIPVVKGLPVSITGLDQYSKFPLDFRFEDVDEYIRDITSADVRFSLNFVVKTGVSCKFEELKIALPKGMSGFLVGGDNKPDANNVLTFKDVPVNNGVFKFKYEVTHIDVKEAGGKFTSEGNGEKGVFELTDNYISLLSANLISNENKTAVLEASFTITPIEILSISGSLKYQLEDITVDTGLEDLPEILKDSQTQLALRNPQLYLRIHNPFAKYGCKASTKISVEQMRSNPDSFLANSERKVSTTGAVTIEDVDIQEYVLSAVKPNSIYDVYGSATWEPFGEPGKKGGLGYIVYGKGLPQYLKFTFTDPMIDSDHITDFPIGSKVNKVYGNYTFYAPLDFAAGSQIVYSQKQTGWDLDDMVITKFVMESMVTSTLSVDVNLSAYPICKNDKGEEYIDYGVQISCSPILAQKEPQKLTIEMESGQTVKNLTGMYYTVKLDAKNAAVLGKHMKFDFDDTVKITVSGYYDMTDDDDDED